MNVVSLPKTIRWILSCTFLLLLVMSGYRLFVHLYFQADNLQGPAFWRTFWMGFRFDCRYAGGVSLFVLLIGFLPGMHIFKTSTGKLAAHLLYTAFMVVLMVTMVAEFAGLVSVHTRLDVSIVTDIIKNTERGRLLIKTIPWITMLIAAGVFSWIFFMMIRFLHYTISRSRSKSTDNKVMRIYWQGLTILLFLLCLYGRLGKAPLSKQIAGLMPTPYMTMLVLNPMEALLSSLRSPKDSPVLMPWPPKKQ